MVSLQFFFFAVANKRPKRANRGQGGVIAQLQTVSEQITEKKKQKRPGHKDILTDIPVNAMAPSGNKTVSFFERPLNILLAEAFLSRIILKLFQLGQILFFIVQLQPPHMSMRNMAQFLGLDQIPTRIQAQECPML